jgi:hypothetical protein
VDWDGGGTRAEKIQIIDANNPNNALDTESVVNFPNGVYLMWNISGHVTINVTLTGGVNAVVSGVFWGQLTGNAATFLRYDTTTQGNWQGRYGADGSSIANYAQVLPSYATLAVQNQLNYIWISGTSDPRALQAGTLGRIASCWYNIPIFNFDLNITDGQVHQLAMYVLDWDGSGTRAETIQILDAFSNAVLATQTVSAFTNGTYLVWSVSGHVKINVTRTGGVNSVMSGLFFN